MVRYAATLPIAEQQRLQHSDLVANLHLGHCRVENRSIIDIVFLMRLTC